MSAREGVMGGAVLLAVVIFAIVAYVGVLAAAIGGSVDALGQPRAAWERAGLRRNRWIWQAVGVVCLPVALVYSGVYFLRIRPRLLGAVRELAVEHCSAHRRPLPHRSADRIDDTSIKIRTAPSVALTIALSFGVGEAVGGGLIPLLASDRVRWNWLVVPPLVALVVILPMYLAFGLTLTPDDLVLRGVTRRALAWCDILAIEPRSQLGSRSVRLWTRSGRGIRLRSPVTAFGVGRQRFDRDVAVLQQWWSAHLSSGGS